MPMLPCRLILGPETPVTIELVATDFNRQRWMVRALRSHAKLRQSLAAGSQAGRVQLIDSTALVHQPSAPPTGTHVVLWDGLNSWLELLDQPPAWLRPDDLVPVCVGVFAETHTALPNNALPLFDQDPSNVQLLTDTAHLRTPPAHDLRAWAQARLRPIRNWRISSQRHRLLEQGGQIVFCGLVQPSPKILRGFMRGSQLAEQSEKWMPLASTPWHGNPQQVMQAIAPLFVILKQTLTVGNGRATGADWACAYTLLNVMQRMAVLSLLSTQTTSLFINEFAKQQHLDPYDAAGYTRNVFLDFGSTRGPDPVYPRTVDLWLNEKPPLSLRFLKPGEPLAAWLGDGSFESFWQTCTEQAQTALEHLARLRTNH